ncbi:uncharacterized protein VTP21DRAFT_10968 [Calcarisporiella thermophila]|uniref:uncharacterized protein n=1 Tax=Calcarisporiella thermophila TaxID=911321 RepID=UPI0037445B44
MSLFSSNKSTKSESNGSNNKEVKSEESWHGLLRRSFLRNFLYNDETVYVQMANIRRSGDIALHSIQFLDFLEDDPQYLIFQLAVNNNSLMGDLKACAKAELCWNMPKSKEHFYLSGRFYIASAPIQVTRYPPPRIRPEIDAASYWEELRLRQWRRLNPQMRSTYTWPPSGETPRANQAYACLSLDAIADDSPQDARRIIHDIALDNFCLLVFKVLGVTHFNYSTFPPTRTVYTLNQEKGKWESLESNP